MERERDVEMLASMVKFAAVENYGPRGFVPKGDSKAMDIFYMTRVDARLVLSGGDYDAPAEGFTRIGLAPLSGFTLPQEKKFVAGFNRSDVAVCIAYYGVDADIST